MFQLTERDWRRSVQVALQESAYFPSAYKEFTKSTQSSASENTGPERTILAHGGAAR
ncbi:hypothetical protein [Tropicibacter sp. S64]|uniref:hypothetical protein n=1 Tax=Tropicibacter sp. S64 TaxID=3415122 RepID=UPI003C79DD47